MVKATDTGTLVPVSDTGTDTGTAVRVPERVPDGRLIDALGATEKRTWITQCLFLKAYARRPYVTSAASAAGISRECVRLWQQRDALGFASRLDDARQAYLDTLESKLDDLALGLEPGQNALALVVKLNAELPRKYRAQQPQDDTAAKVLGEFRSLFAATRGVVSWGHDAPDPGLKEPPAPA